MKLRRRLVSAVTGLTLITLGGAFAVVFVAVNRSQERQLDAALLAEAHEEAHGKLAVGDDQLIISDRPGPAANDVGPLPKYGAIYSVSGRVLASTPTFREGPPPLAALAPRHDRPFDLWHRGEHLRGVVTPVAAQPTRMLLLAVPRIDLDGDAAFLGRAMVLVFLVAVVWAAMIATWVVRRLTRGHEMIAAVARRVAAGDLSARVPSGSGNDEVAQLARDINHMIAQLSSLLSSQQEFIAHAAHELRSPLTTLYGELSYALRRPRDADSYRRTIEDALDGARRLKTLAEDLLALARLAAVSDEPTQLVALKEALASAVRHVAPASRDGQVRVRGADAITSGRSIDLERLFRNLIENAVRHSPADTIVDVSIETARDHIVVRFFNEGDPIPEQERERIFEPFRRGARENAEGRTGTGLGLAIARQIARSHGGEVYLQPAQSAGVEFRVELPLAAGVNRPVDTHLSGPMEPSPGTSGKPSNAIT